MWAALPLDLTKKTNLMTLMNLSRLLICCLIVTAVAPGCGRRKETSPPATQSQVVPPQMPIAKETPPPAPPVPISTGVGEAQEPSSVSTDSPEASRQQELLRLKPAQGDGQIPTEKAIIWAVDRYEEKYSAYPKDIYELVAKGLLKAPPAPPAGKKYFLDAHNRTLSLVDK
jgi:hypothetical protein